LDLVAVVVDGFLPRKEYKGSAEKVVGFWGEMCFENNHVGRMTVSCAQREDGNISLRVRTVISGRIV
jgi:hypothetical protein